MSLSGTKALTFGNSCVLIFQLQQEIKDLKKAHTELSEQIKSFEKSQKDLEVALTHREDNINVSSFPRMHVQFSRIPMQPD